MTTEPASFPRRHARTQRFTLGAPRAFTVAPDGSRVVFLCSASGTDRTHRLWVLDVADGTGRLAADPGRLFTAELRVGTARELPVPGLVIDPCPSPDGRHIAYVTGGALRVVGAAGQGDRVLAEPEFHIGLNFSPGSRAGPPPDNWCESPTKAAPGCSPWVNGR